VGVGRVLVTDVGHPAAADYAAYVNRRGNADVRQVSLEPLSEAELHAATAGAGETGLVLFLGPSLTSRCRGAVDALIRVAREQRVSFVAVISSHRVHLGDHDTADAEAFVRGRLEGLPARTAIFRPGHILSPHSRAGAWLQRFGALYPLVPRRLRGCCVGGDELFAAIEAERHSGRAPRPRVFALLGPNQAWRDLLARHRAEGVPGRCLTALAAVLAFLCVGHVAALVLDLIARVRPRLRSWNFDTLRPASMQELLALVNPYNARHVKVVGYNNGVVHFGHRYPGRTVVSTARCDRIVHAGTDRIKADCGVTVRRTLDFLAGSNQELYVVPNYSYVCLGTAFFIPIHGSAADCSTIADTITRVVLYDPGSDRIIAADRDAPAFRDHVYNLKAEALVLRLYLRVKAKSRYYLRREEIDDPGSEALLAALRDDHATNVEVRQSRAASRRVTICRFYNDPGASPAPVLELPRDALGRLWDRLEENPVTSYLFHALIRSLAWHVELFFSADEFATFWHGHGALPLRKIQLRYIRRDGLPHSAFREHDCVSADLFMLRRHRQTFEAYLHRTFATVRSNPGKHSQ
jgi:hypothetical protein